VLACQEILVRNDGEERAYLRGFEALVCRSAFIPRYQLDKDDLINAGAIWQDSSVVVNRQAAICEYLRRRSASSFPAPLRRALGGLHFKTFQPNFFASHKHQELQQKSR